MEVAEQRPRRIQSIEFADIDEFTDMAYQKGWTDGLPVLPPTEKKVTAMLDYLKPRPAGIARRRAAGRRHCDHREDRDQCGDGRLPPRYLPVVITAVEAMLDPGVRADARAVHDRRALPARHRQRSGREEAWLQFRRRRFRRHGHRVNSAIGRAVRLVLWNIGLGRPGQMSHATMGHPGRYCYLVAERPPEEDNPWEPIHVTNGLEARGQRGLDVSVGHARPVQLRHRREHDREQSLRRERRAHQSRPVPGGDAADARHQSAGGARLRERGLRQDQVPRRRFSRCASGPCAI